MVGMVVWKYSFGLNKQRMSQIDVLVNFATGKLGRAQVKFGGVNLSLSKGCTTLVILLFQLFGAYWKFQNVSA